jgi:ABC-type multidrug transport system permease subunit
MLRCIELIFFHEFRLQLRDRPSLFMLFVAPVVIIAVAGFSLGNLFGAPAAHNDYLLAVVDQDHGRIARTITEALAHEPGCKLVKAADLDDARRIVLGNARAPLAVVIPPNTTADVDSGRTATVELLLDPLKRLQASAIELRLTELSQQFTSLAQAEVRRQFTERAAELRAHFQEAITRARALEAAILAYRHQFTRARKTAQQELQATIQRQLQTIEAQSQASINQAIALTRERLDQAMAEKRVSAEAIEAYLEALSKSQGEFNRWFVQLKEVAGRNARRIPPAPSLPPPPSRKLLAQLTQPVVVAIARPQLPTAEIAKLNLTIPDLPPLPKLSLDPPPTLTTPISFPGTIAWKDTSLTSSRNHVSAFEQYVPGFGVTFLLIDMLWGMSVALMDERQWGTLRRLRISGASTVGMLIGRLAARTVIGFLQMIVLFGVGWLLFGINLGTRPAMLLLPAGAIAFGAAAFGLVVATIAPSRDSVLPIGSVAAMVMSALGGCWWPLEFEPAWMRLAALSVPTTWTMRAFNDLMIRGLEPGSALWPTTMAFVLGVVLLLAGIVGSPRLYR